MILEHDIEQRHHVKLTLVMSDLVQLALEKAGLPVDIDNLVKFQVFVDNSLSTAPGYTKIEMDTGGHVKVLLILTAKNTTPG